MAENTDSEALVGLADRRLDRAVQVGPVYPDASSRMDSKVSDASRWKLLRYPAEMTASCGDTARRKAREEE